MKKVSPPLALDRIALALSEGRHEHSLTRDQLAGLAGVSYSTVRRLEEGRRISPKLLMRIAVTMVVLDAHGEWAT